MLWRSSVDLVIKSAVLVKTEWTAHYANTVHEELCLSAALETVGRLFQV